MSPVPRFDSLETDRLVLRQRRVEEAAIYRQLWIERDPRVPPHRRIDPEGRPTLEDIAAQIRAEGAESRPGILAVERKEAAEVIGYCGLVFRENGSPEEPELVYELLRAARGCGYATEAGRAVLAWLSEAGYERVWPPFGTGTFLHDGSSRSSGSAKQAGSSATPFTATAC